MNDKQAFNNQICFSTHLNHISTATVGGDIPKRASADLVPQKELGEGGFGKVILAKYKHGTEVAVKIFDVE